MTNFNRYLLLFLLTPIYYVSALWSSALPHEYAHTTVAWLFGFKSNPFAIQYGGLHWKNIFLLANLEDTVNYYLMYLLGHQKAAGLAAFAGPGIATVGLYLISLLLLQCSKIRKHVYLFYFVFWLNLINLSELFSYVFLRPFHIQGDTGIAAFNWGISPWWTLIVGGSLLLIAFWHFFTNTFIECYRVMRLEAATAKVILLLLCTFLLFVFPGIYIVLHIAYYGIFTATLAAIACAMMPLMIIICWPTREWVVRQLGVRCVS